MAAAVFDLDTLLQPDWTEALGRRAFPVDAFLSHNRNDASAEVADALRDLDVAIWYDGHVDLADRRVHQRVARAIRSARYVLVCIGRDFRSTDWVGAECRPALGVARRGDLTRVVILDLDGDARVPEELASTPRFAVRDLDLLATFLREGNVMPTEPAGVLDAARKRRDREWPSIVIAHPPAGPSPLSRGAALLADEAARAPGFPIYSDGAFALRNFLQLQPEALPDSATALGQALRRLALDMTRSANTDNRANAIMMLAAMDGHWREADTLSDLTACLCLEDNANVIGVAIYDAATVSMRAAQDDLDRLMITALRAPRDFAHAEAAPLTSKFPESVRCRIHVREGLDALSRSENLLLIRSRLDAVLDALSEGSPQLAEALGGAAMLLSIPELEIILRRLCAEVLAFRPGDQAWAPDVGDKPGLLEGALEVFEAACKPSSVGHRGALLQMAEWALDFVLIPLMLYRSAPALWPRAKSAAEQLCDAIAPSPRFGSEASDYRNVIAQVDAGGDLGRALDELLFS